MGSTFINPFFSTPPESGWTLRFSDDFNRADGVVGSNYIEVNPVANRFSAYPAVRSNAYSTMGSTSSASAIETVINPATYSYQPNQAVEVQYTDVHPASASRDPTLSLFLRATQSTNPAYGICGYRVQISETLPCWIQRWHLDGITKTDLSSFIFGGVASLNDVFRFEINGYTLNVYRNGTLLLSATDGDVSNQIASGQVGIRFSGFSNGGAINYLNTYEYV